MKKNKGIGKKIVMFCTAVILVLLSVTGCGKDGKKVSDIQDKGDDSGKAKAMGRYIEQDIKLPEKETMKTILSLQKNTDGSLILFTKDISGKFVVYYNYTLKEDKQWEKKECKWLNDLKLESKNTNLTIVLGKDNKQYAFYYSTEEDKEKITIPQSRIVSTVDGIKAEEIKIPALAKKDANGWFPYINGMRVLANGNLVLSDSSQVNVYQKSTGKRIMTFSTESGNQEIADNTIYHYNTQASSIDSYNGENGKQLKSQPLTLKEPYGVKLDIKEDNTLVVYSKEGIQILKEGSDLWEVVANGNSGTIGSPRFYCNSFSTGSQDDYYVYYNSMEEGIKLSHYIFDKNTPVEPDTTLTVYALKDNSVIRQAASEFQVANPSVKIEFQVAAGEDTAAIDEDYIRTLNTELLAGKGPDILVLDGLPQDSFIEKGVLKDMSSIVNPMVASGDLLPNIAKAYTVDGKIYMIPTKIGIPMAFGDEKLTAIAGDLSKIAEYMEKNPDKTIFGTVDQKAMISFYLDAFSQELVQKEGNLNIEQVKLFLENMKQILDGSTLADEKKNIYPSSVYRLIEDGNLLYISNITGFFQSEGCFTAIKQINASFNQVNQSFLPIGKIGINNAGKNQDIAEQFVKAVLSTEAQGTDYYDGFPVNKKALENYINMERTSADSTGGPFKGADGKTYEMLYAWPTKEQRQGMIRICEAATKEALFDDKLKEIILEKAVNYFKGSQSLDETAEKIEQATKAYLTE